MFTRRLQPSEISSPDGFYLPSTMVPASDRWKLLAWLSGPRRRGHLRSEVVTTPPTGRAAAAASHGPSAVSCLVGPFNLMCDFGCKCTSVPMRQWCTFTCHTLEATLHPKLHIPQVILNFSFAATQRVVLKPILSQGVFIWPAHEKKALLA